MKGEGSTLWRGGGSHLAPECGQSRVKRGPEILRDWGRGEGSENAVGE